MRAARYGSTGWQGINTIDIDPSQPAGVGPTHVAAAREAISDLQERTS